MESDVVDSETRVLNLTEGNYNGMRHRCLFPSIVVTLHGLDPEKSYTLMVDMESSSDQRYTYTQERGWCPSAPARQQQSSGVYIHSDTPALGAELNKKPISFKLLKICTTNGIGNKGMIPLTPMHKYKPRIHLIQNTEELKSKLCSWTYCFPETEFIAVGHYHSKKMKKMKIEYNPYAKGALPHSRRQNNISQSVIVLQLVLVVWTEEKNNFASDYYYPEATPMHVKMLDGNGTELVFEYIAWVHMWKRNGERLASVQQ
ncbi:T-box transcription factor mls-1-like [Mustelus asterias]